MKSNPFQRLIDRENEITNLANEYLSKYEEISEEKMAKAIWKKGWEIGKEIVKNGGDCPSWVECICDGYIPYYHKGTRNGSIYFMLAFSLASNDAHFRNLYEHVVNGESLGLPFPVLAERKFLR